MSDPCAPEEQCWQQEHKDISLAAFPSSCWQGKADFLVPSRRGHTCFVYSLCWNYSSVGEGEHFDILHGSEFTVNIQTLKEPPSPNYISTIRLFKPVFSSGLLEYLCNQAKSSGLLFLPLGIHGLEAWHCPGSWTLFILWCQGKHNAL